MSAHFPSAPLARRLRGVALLSVLAAALGALLAACASPAIGDANQLSLQGHAEQALGVLDAARKLDPADPALLAAQQRQREFTLSILANQAATARSAGRADLARDLLARLIAIDPTHPRTVSLREELQRDAHQNALLVQAGQAIDAGHLDQAQAILHAIQVESPGLPAARVLQQRINDATPITRLPEAVRAALNKHITFEFHDAPLRSVLESIGRTLGVNFVFDKDVRVDNKVTILLHEVTLDEALRVILSTQQLDRKLLNESTMFVYPNTPIKQQEHQELVTRSFYLTNSDTKQAQTLIKTMAKTRDIYVDERLNLIIVRDTPEAVQMIERLIASIDLPEPEVTLEVEVMEIGTNELDSLGLQWPDTVNFGVPNFVGDITHSDSSSLRVSIANPAIVATLNGSSGSTNLIANPKLRARNHEKAKVQIGERLPVFTSSAVANVGSTTSVTYIDTGLKLEVEPSVQLDNDVIIKVNLEVTNLIGQVTGPQGSIAYRVGTRDATTSLRLRDGETQILAGLINNEDSKAIQGIPGASQLPIVGRLFGVHSDTHNKSEIVLLITPRVVRNLDLPDGAIQSGAGGSYNTPGAASLRIGQLASVAMPALRGGSAAAAAEADANADGQKPAPDEPSQAVVEVTTTGQAAVGATASVTLHNQSNAVIHGQFGFDAQLLQPAGVEKSNPAEFTLPPMGQKVYVLRALPNAAGKSSRVQIDGLTATAPSGQALAVRVDGDLSLDIAAQ